MPIKGETVNEMLTKARVAMVNELGFNEADTIEFLEKVFEAQRIINTLTGWTWADKTHEPLSHAYEELDKLLSPICSDCHVRADRFMTSPAELYDPGMAELPGGIIRRWTGEWYCPKCRHLVAVGPRWWRDEDTNQRASE